MGAEVRPWVATAVATPAVDLAAVLRLVGCRRALWRISELRRREAVAKALKPPLELALDVTRGRTSVKNAGEACGCPAAALSDRARAESPSTG